MLVGVVCVLEVVLVGVCVVLGALCVVVVCGCVYWCGLWVGVSVSVVV